jgi:hypothetical protein
MEEKKYSKNEPAAPNGHIQMVNDLLKAKYIGALPPGHTGAFIYRIQRLSDQINLIVKQAPNSNPIAKKELEENIFAYEKIKEVGGEQVLPPNLEQVEIPGNQTLIMKDLGKTFCKADIEKGDYEKLWSSFEGLVSGTSLDTKSLDATLYSKEILSHIQRFVPDEIEMMEKIMRFANALPVEGKAAIMLLDFTPDNVFLKDGKVFFIDPWKQETYLGHPAVSIGQFTTLVELYKLKDGESNSRILIEKCLERLPVLLGCSKESVEFALKLGSTLQLVLSAHVRQESDITKHRELINIARKKWD